MELQMYDEDLTQNPFFLHLKEEEKHLYDKSTNNRWTVGVTLLLSLSQ